MYDPVWIRTLLARHISVGSVSFLIAPVPLCAAKSGRAHRLWGKIYFWAMAGVSASALILACYRPVLSPGLVTVFSFYNAFIGYRVLKIKRLASNSQQDLRLDWSVGALTFLASLTLAAFAILRPAWIQNMTIPGAMVGLLGMGISGKAMWGFLHPPTDKIFWWYGHLQGMVA